MKLVASVIVHNEADRFLQLCIESLFTFCDEIRAVDDCSEDGSDRIMRNLGVQVHRNERPMFYEHEGRARQRLLEWTMEAAPSHILVIDCDEIVVDGQALRTAVEAPQEFPTLAERRRGGRRVRPAQGVWSLQMQEVWGASETALQIRQDGGWKEHPVPIVFAVPAMDRQTLRHWHLPDRALACGRVPVDVAVRSNRSNAPVVTQIIHLGWSCRADRENRYQRYVKHDSGKFHANSHLESIMWPDAKVQLTERAWPESLTSAKSKLLDRINR